MKKILSFLVVFAFFMPSAYAGETVTITLKTGDVVIELLPEIAPNHVKQIKAIAAAGSYDNVAFHRVIDGFMAQTGDVKFGNMKKDFNLRRAGTGGSELGYVKAEFSSVPFKRGVVGMARGPHPDSANSQFFIMLKENNSLNGSYTVWGRVISGMEFVDKIKKGSQAKNGAVTDPDYIVEMR